MLRKLMKHEFRATGRIMGPLYLVLLVASLGGNLSIRLMDSTDSTALNILGSILMMAFTVAIIGVCVMTLVLMIQRFRTNLMGDEGYVMFTLPASIHQQIWSKLIVSSVWFIATGIAVILSALILVYEVGFMTQFLQEIQLVLDQITAYYALNGAAFVAEMLVLIFLGCAACCLEFYAAMAVGHSFANHKMLLSVVFFFVFQFAMQLIGSFGLVGLSNLNIWDWNLYLDGMTAVHTMMGLFSLITLAYGAVFYVVTAIFLKKRLNLE